MIRQYAFCQPPKYNRKNTRKGSFFCPIKALTDDGHFADSHNIIQEQLELDEIRTTYQSCPSQAEKEDAIVCSMEFGESGDIDKEALEALSGSAKLTHTTQCEHVKEIEDGLYSSNHLYANYTSSTCPLGDAFASCARASPSDTCSGNDFQFTFRGRIGKLVRVPKDEQEHYGVLFNDGRTAYDFPKHHVQIQIPPSNYELFGRCAHLIFYQRSVL